MLINIDFKKLMDNKLLLWGVAALTLTALCITGFIYRDRLERLFTKKDIAKLKYVAYKKNDDDRWGIIDIQTGKIVLENEWQNMPVIIGYDIVKVSNKDDKFELYKIAEKPLRIGDEYKNAGDYSEGLIPVAKENQYITFLDTEGKEVLKVKELEGKLVESVGVFSEGLARFKNEDGKWGFFDKSGKVVIKARYKSVSDFAEGIARVEEETSADNVTATAPSTMSTDAPRSFEGGLPPAPAVEAPRPVQAPLPMGARAPSQEFRSPVSKIKKGFIDRAGKEAIKLTPGIHYQDIYEGMIPFTDDDGKTYGFMNAKGEKVIKPSKDFRSVGQFNDGYAAFYDGDKWGIVNKKGETVVRAKYDFALASSGRIYIKDKNKVGFLDYEGKEIIKPQYDAGLPFIGERALVKDGNKFIIIDKKGNQIGKIDFKYVDGESTLSRVHNSNQKPTVESDFFDANAVADMIIQKLSRKEINGIKNGMTLGTVMKDYRISEDSLSQYGNTAIGEPIQRLSKYADVVPEFRFDTNVKEPIKQRQAYGYYVYENIVGYRPNYSAKVDAVSYNIRFYNSNAMRKSAEIFKALNSKFEKAGFKPDPNNFGHNTVRYIDNDGLTFAAVEKNGDYSFVVAFRLN